MRMWTLWIGALWSDWRVHVRTNRHKRCTFCFTHIFIYSQFYYSHLIAWMRFSVRLFAARIIYSLFLLFTLQFQLFHSYWSSHGFFFHFNATLVFAFHPNAPPNAIVVALVCLIFFHFHIFFIQNLIFFSIFFDFFKQTIKKFCAFIV